MASIRFNAGQRLGTAERVDFASPPLSDPGNLELQLRPDQTVGILVTDVNKEPTEEQLLFLAGISAGLAGSLVVWILQIILEARGMLPENDENESKS